jgi:hypothetical protein
MPAHPIAIQARRSQLAPESITLRYAALAERSTSAKSDPRVAVAS